MAGNNYNPFALRDSHSQQTVTTYKITTILSWLLVVISTVYYDFHVPDDGDVTWRHTIWGVNRLYNRSPFHLNSIIASLYWLAVFLLQIGYVWGLFSANADFVHAAAGVGSHFIFNNLLQFGWVLLFVRGHYWWSEVLLIINFFNLSSLYFRHNTHPRFIHIPVTTGPLAWTFVALYWNGAIAVNAYTQLAYILANVAIWGILVYGMFFLVVYKDYTMGFALSILSASLGVGQFFTKIIAFQWIFAFTIMATLFVFSLLIGIPGIFGKEFTFRREGQVVPADQERAPLLEDP